MSKRILICAWLLAGAVFLCAAQGGDFSSDKKVSYAIGVLLARSLEESGISVDFPSFADGLKKALITKDAGISHEEATALVQSAFTVILDKQKVENLEASNQFLTENGKKKGIRTTKSGLQYEILQKGKGASPQKDSVVVVHYTGSLIDGTIFDSSRERDEPASIPLEQVIPGWTEGIQLMQVGGRSRFYIPPNLAYGENAPGDIPPNSVLVFDVELLEIETE